MSTPLGATSASAPKPGDAKIINTEPLVSCYFSVIPVFAVDFPCLLFFSELEFSAIAVPVTSTLFELHPATRSTSFTRIQAN